MGILTIQFGQCGNQLAQAVFKYLVNDIVEPNSTSVSKLENEYRDASKELWFSSYKSACFTPRSVLVDTEKKVVSSLTDAKDSLKFDNIVAKSGGGSANNWAFGYSLKADMLLNDVIESVRHEVEKCDDVTHILSFLSSGGGTGSGTGSRVLESLREQYPNKVIMNVIVLPYSKGEIVTQNYNTLLTVAKLYDITDGCIMLQNDRLHRICNSLLSMKNVDLNDINTVAAQKICATFQPAGNNSLWTFASQLTSQPNFKFVQINTVPHIAKEHVQYESEQDWSTLLRYMRNVVDVKHHVLLENSSSTVSQRSGREVAVSCSFASNLLVSRGGTSIPDVSALEIMRDKQLYGTWVPEFCRFEHFHQQRQLYNTNKFLALASNSNSICDTFDAIIEQAWTMFNHRAYLHQYSKYGITQSDFEGVFEKMESILYNYREIMANNSWINEGENIRDISDKETTDEPSAKRRCIRTGTLSKSNEFSETDLKWSVNEKQQLFNALVKYGSSDLDALARHIPTKNKSAIFKYILYLERMARTSLKDDADEKGKARQAPIDMWIQYVCHMSLSDDYKLMDISRAVKFIALFEERNTESKVDIRDCYEVVAACLSGNAPKHVNPETSKYLADNLQKLAMDTKMTPNISENKFISGLPQRKECKTYRSKKQIKVEKIEEFSFVTNKIMNPLKIPENLLIAKK
ncbi:beta-Tubulin at 97EF [Carabus blaptoides fortunei]